MDENLDAICRRIKKLLAIAADHRGSPEEAAAAAGMAQRIMAKYQLEHQDILIAELKTSDNFGEAEHVAPTFGRRSKLGNRWYGALVVAVVKANDCHCEWIDSTAGQIKLYGVKSDVEVAGYMIAYLADQIQYIAKAFYTLTKNNERTIDFRAGIVDTLIKALKTEKVETTGNALVIAKHAAIFDHFGKTMRIIKYKHSINSDRESGQVAGKSIDLNRHGIRGETQGQRFLS